MEKESELLVDLVGLEGSYYDIGREQGKQLELGSSFEIMKSMNQHVDVLDATRLLAEISPNLLLELEGLARGMDIEIETALKVYSGYDFAFPRMGCTALAQESIYVRNYDFSPELYDARFVFCNPENGYASIGFSQQITGRLDGMNEKGLVVGLHLVNEEKGGKGFLGTTVVRMVLDLCKNVDEAIDLISSIPHGYCMNFSMTDNSGKHVIIECSSETQSVRNVDPLICTNHFESTNLQEMNRPEIGGSLERKKHLNELFKDKLTPLDAYHHFNDVDSPLFFTDYKAYFGTLHTVVYCPEDLRVIVGVGANCDPFEFSFTDWLEGKMALPDVFKGIIMDVE